MKLVSFLSLAAVLSVVVVADQLTTSTVYPSTPIKWDPQPNKGRMFKFNPLVMYSTASLTFLLVLALL